MGLIHQHERLVKHLRTQDELTQLLKTIDYLPQYIGAQPFGQDHTPIVLIANFIMKRFGTITPEQIIDAFEMAASGDLYDGHVRVKVTTYGKPLDIDVVGTVLMAYKQWLQNEAKRPKLVASTTPVSHQLTEGEKWKPTPEFFYELMMRTIEKEGELPKVMLWETIHDHMVGLGMLKPITKVVQPTKRLVSMGDALALDVHRISIHRYLLKTGVLKRTEP